MSNDPVVVAMFKAYCEIRGMDPADWPIIGDRKQAAWNAAAEAARAAIASASDPTCACGGPLLCDHCRMDSESD